MCPAAYGFVVFFCYIAANIPFYTASKTHVMSAGRTFLGIKQLELDADHLSPIN
jgi:hypothetical protein